MRKVLALAALLTSFAILPVPFAAASEGDTEIAKQQADVSYQAGVRLFRKGDYRRALIEFTKANAVYPRGSTSRNMGLCEMKLNRPLDALRHLHAAVAAPEVKPELREVIEQEVAEAYALTGHILVHSTDAAATVSVDGQALGAAPGAGPVDVVPGHHVVEARVGTRTTRAEVDAPVGVVVTAELAFPEPPGPVAATAPSPAPTTSLPAAGRAPLDGTGQASYDGSWWDGRNIAGVVVAGTGLATLVVAVGMGAAGSSKASDAQNYHAAHPDPCADRASSTCGSYTSLINSHNNDVTWSRVLYVSAGVLAAGAVVLLWPHQRREAMTGVWVAPAAAPNIAGLLLGGSF